MGVVKVNAIKTISGHVSGSYVRILFDWLAQVYPALYRAIPYSQPEVGELNRVSVTQWRAMLEWVAEQGVGSRFPFELAESVRPANMGLLGYIAMCSNNLGEAFVRLQQFENLIYSVNTLKVASDEHSVSLIWGQEKGRPGHWVDTVAIAILLAYTRQLVGESITPLHVAFINPTPENPADFERYFGCQVDFNAQETSVSLPVEVLSCPMRTPDSHMQKLLDQQAEQMLKQVQASESDPLGPLRLTLCDCVAAGLPCLTEVAKRLHRSERSIQRDLAAHGSSFRQELLRVRTEIAQTMLSSAEMTLADIASYLAYNDQAAFTHAFKRATGMTPAAYRQMQGSKLN